MLKSALELVSKRPSCSLKYLSTAVQSKSTDRLQTFRTQEHEPSKHTFNHLGQFYTFSASDKNRLFPNGTLPKSLEMQFKTFNEACLMVRQPAMDVIDCLRNLDYSKPAVRFVLYGPKGSGKTVSLAHILHYGLKENFVLVHVPWVGNWMRRCKEFSNSEKHEGFSDINIDAAAWLAHFKYQNAHHLAKPEMITGEEYVWSKREKTEKGSPLIHIIDHGINRIKFASECVRILAKELKTLSNSGVCKTLVAIDGFNSFFYPHTKIYTEKKEMVHPNRVTVTEAFTNLTKFDWKNSAIVVTVDELACLDEEQLSHLPMYLLGREGFEHLDPFVPVPVGNYTEKELISCMNYYRERRWVTPYEGQDEEISALSSNNPYGVMRLSAGL